MDLTGRTDFRILLQKTFLKRKKDRPIHDLILVYALLSMIFFTIIQVLVNLFIGIPERLTFYNVLAAGVLILFCILTQYSSLIVWVRYSFGSCPIFGSEGKIWFICC